MSLKDLVLPGPTIVELEDRLSAANSTSLSFQDSMLAFHEWRNEAARHGEALVHIARAAFDLVRAADLGCELRLEALNAALRELDSYSTGSAQAKPE